MKFYNDEYLILSAASLIMHIFIISFGVSTSLELLSSIAKAVVSIVELTLLIASVVAIIIIRKVSCAENTMMKKTPYYLNEHIKHAVDLGLIQKGEEEQVVRVLDPKKHEREG